MKQETITIYGINELSEKARERAIKDHRFMNIDGELWYEFLYDDFKAELKTIGIDASNFYWNLEGGYRHFSIGECDIDSELLLKSAGVEKELIALKMGSEDIEIEVNIEYKDHRGWGKNAVGVNIRDYDDTLEEGFKDEMEKNISDKIIMFLEHNYFNKYLKALEEAYEYETSDECIIETLDINGHTFLENGECWK